MQLTVENSKSSVPPILYGTIDTQHMRADFNINDFEFSPEEIQHLGSFGMKR